MIEKIRRYARRSKKNIKYIFNIWFPAVILLIFMGILIFFVGTSRTGTFRFCTAELKQCLASDEKTGPFERGWRIVVCGYQTAWCDAKVLWLRVKGEDCFPEELPVPGMPPVDEKAEEELFKRLTDPEKMAKRVKEFNASHPPVETKLKSSDEMMEKARQERILLEKSLKKDGKLPIEEKSGQDGQ